ncbi:nucleotide pyrophosphohydrolase [Candidatus Saccharibacteria bacterium]|jgi:NTP pyrophosphatase (non-canonical NTP hydrolase)|nr:nucleotide pyrophosphohydrolase [Candidatus Saccharibacteria bacterium]
MKNLQEKIKNFSAEHHLGGAVETRFMDLVSEVGELGKEILKGTNYGEEEYKKTENLESEMGDALFALVMCANAADVDLDRALKGVLEKYEKRFAHTKTIGSGK